jgi:hypothetical protein
MHYDFPCRVTEKPGRLEKRFKLTSERETCYKHFSSLFALKDHQSIEAGLCDLNQEIE